MDDTKNRTDLIEFGYGALKLFRTDDGKQVAKVSHAITWSSDVSWMPEGSANTALITNALSVPGDDSVEYARLEQQSTEKLPTMLRELAAAIEAKLAGGSDFAAKAE